MGYKVLTDGNGSKLIQVVGMGCYMPLSEYQKIELDLKTTNRMLNEANDEILNLFSENQSLLCKVERLVKAINENCFGPCHEPDGSVGVDGYPWAFKVLSEIENIGQIASEVVEK